MHCYSISVVYKQSHVDELTVCQLRPQINTVFKVCRVFGAAQQLRCSAHIGWVHAAGLQRGHGQMSDACGVSTNPRTDGSRSQEPVVTMCPPRVRMTRAPAP